MKPGVSIETTIPSFSHEVRTEPEMIARRDWRREWWDHHRVCYDVCTSEAVIEELEIGTFPGKDKALALIALVLLLAVHEAIATPRGDRSTMKDDPTITAIREARHKISAAVIGGACSLAFSARAIDNP